MRRILVLCVGLVFCVPATAFAIVPFALGDGTLAVRGGDGTVTLKLRSGVVLGRMATGTLEVVDPDVACEDLLVWQADETTPTKRDTCRFRSMERDGTPMRFRLLRGDNEIRLHGRGLFISAVGRGKVRLEGSDERVRDGQYSINAAPFKSLPDEGGWLAIGSS